MITDKDMSAKLEEVAASLDAATIRLNDIAHQHNFELVKERISRSEREIASLKRSVERLREKNTAERDLTEKDFSGLRALVFSSFVLSFVCLAGIILLSTKI